MRIRYAPRCICICRSVPEARAVCNICLSDFVTFIGDTEGRLYLRAIDDSVLLFNCPFAFGFAVRRCSDKQLSAAPTLDVHNTFVLRICLVENSARQVTTCDFYFSKDGRNCREDPPRFFFLKKIDLP